MDIALTSIKFSLGLNLLLLAVSFFLVFFSDNSNFSSLLWLAIGLLFLTFFLYTLAKGFLWAALIYLPLCFFDFFEAISQGLKFENTLNLIDAIFSFTAAIGLIMWLRERNSNSNQSGPTV